MTQYLGIPLSKGIVIGKIKYYERDRREMDKTMVDDPEAEKKRYDAARSAAIAELNRLYEEAAGFVGEDGAQIFCAHAMLLQDEAWDSTIRHMILSERSSAQYAVAKAEEKFAKTFESMEDEILRERGTDVRDIADRLIRILSGHEEDKSLQEEKESMPEIILAKELTPSQTLSMAHAAAFVTRDGSANSHAAILARSMGIPAVSGISQASGLDGKAAGLDGKTAIVDGYEGLVILDPDGATIQKYQEKIRKMSQKRADLQTLIGKESVTKDGRSIQLLANIDGPKDLDKVLSNDAEGIGLFRSECLFLGRETLPTEEEQFLVYQKVLETMGNRKVVIRTMDIGADKVADCLGLEAEQNPALGQRGIRVSLMRPEVFRTQLRALYRASAYGNLWIMYPMIVSEDEVLKIKEITKSVREELIEEIRSGEAMDFTGGEEDPGRRIDAIKNVREGIMIETPAAAILSDVLAEHADFFSIGTNDLSQYTMAIDRQNSKLESFFDPHHPAVLRMIETTVENGHKAGIPVGICGELAADTTLTKTFLQMGIDSLSVAPGEVLTLRSAVRS